MDKEVTTEVEEIEVVEAEAGEGAVEEGEELEELKVQRLCTTSARVSAAKDGDVSHTECEQSYEFWIDCRHRPENMQPADEIPLGQGLP